MAPHDDPAELPSEFVAAAAAVRAARVRPEVLIEETAAPQRLAPYVLAITADVVVDGEELATGRLVLLHDPAGHETWEGRFRLVTFARAELEPEMAADPLLTRVAWSWLSDALEQRSLEHAAIAGTVTRTASESFAAMADKPAEAQVEVRASWTPPGPDVSAHVEAWTEMLCTAAGLAPLPPGVVAIPTARNRRR
jgi:hypothetical protein